jgi:hypothetical protein
MFQGGIWPLPNKSLPFAGVPNSKLAFNLPKGSNGDLRAAASCAAGWMA